MTDLAAKTLASIDERWRSLTIANDFVFCKAMLDADLCREVLEAILGVSIERVEYVGRQETLDAGAESKSVRLDVYVRDEKGTVYNVEMQSSDTRELPQRARYYHSLLTCNQLRHGSSYKDLKDVYVIFICSFDLFSQGRRVYSFENRCEGLESLTLGDGSKTIFLAADAPASNGCGARVDELLDYVSSGRVTGELSARLAAAVADVLDNEKWRLEFMMLEVRDQLNFDRGEKLGRELGLAQGRALGLAEGLEQGHEAGLAEGIEQGREAGLAEGIERGREAGLAEGIEQGREAGLAEGIEQGREAGLAEGIEQGREAGLAEGLERGREAGRSEGQRCGEERLARLLSALMNDGRQEEIVSALSDAPARESLYLQYGIE